MAPFYPLIKYLIGEMWNEMMCTYIPLYCCCCCCFQGIQQQRSTSNVQDKRELRNSSLKDVFSWWPVWENNKKKSEKMTEIPSPLIRQTTYQMSHISLSQNIRNSYRKRSLHRTRTGNRRRSTHITAATLIIIKDKDKITLERTWN